MSPYITIPLGATLALLGALLSAAYIETMQSSHARSRLDLFVLILGALVGVGFVWLGVSVIWSSV